MLGIDLSTWNTVTDYGAAARAASYVILKAGGSNTGSRYTDSGYARHCAGLAPHGVPTASYWMNGAGTAQADADYFVSILRPEASAAAVLDLEKIDGYAIWSPTKALEWFRRVRALRPDLPLFAYMNSSAADDHDWSALEREGIKLWVANFGRNDGTRTSTTPSTGSWSGWAIHQFTDRGRHPGVAGSVDLNWAPSAPFERAGQPSRASRGSVLLVMG